MQRYEYLIKFTNKSILKWIKINSTIHHGRWSRNNLKSNTMKNNEISHILDNTRPHGLMRSHNEMFQIMVKQID